MTKESEASRDSAREELFLVSALAALLSLLAFAFFYRRGEILLWGDAVAHLNIARRLFESRHPSWEELRSLWLDQLGSVWLPLPHLLVAPFVMNEYLWRSGIGGSIPSMAAYVLGVAGIFRLVRARATRAGAWLAAGIYAFNPSLLYMQATAMTESIFLAALIWSVVYFDEFRHGLQAPSIEPRSLAAWRALERGGLCLAAAIFTRYDGWIFAFVIGVSSVAIVAFYVWQHPQGGPHLPAVGKCGGEIPARRLLRSTASFLLLLSLCPALWLAHNYKLNRRPLDWLNGPYSAKAIERRTSRPGDPPYPGKDHMKVAAEYFLKAARMNTGEGARENWLLAIACAGALVAVSQPRRFGAFFLLWIPLPFYAYSIAYGSVPIFVPEWWPFSYYNVRYGLELLPAMAAFAGVIPNAVPRRTLCRFAGGPHLPAVGKCGASSKGGPDPRPAFGRKCGNFGSLGAVILFVLVLLSYNSSAWCFSPRWRDREWPRHWMIPICWREAWVNSRSRMAMEAQVAQVLSELPPNSTLLMYTSDYVGALQQAGIHFDRVISESSFIDWDAALSAPFASADYIVAVDGDPVADAVRLNPRGLTALVILHTQGKPKVTIYRSSRP